MACENDKCEKYGMHHDYVDGVEVRKCQFCRRDDQIEDDKIMEYGTKVVITEQIEFNKKLKDALDPYVKLGETTFNK